MRELILQEISRLAEAADGKPPGEAAFRAATGITESKWRGIHWARWGDAVSEAGYMPNRLQTAFAESDVLFPIARLTRSLGRLPTRTEIKLQSRRSPGLPSLGAVYRRYPTNQRLIEALCTLSGQTAWKDIAALLPMVTDAQPIKTNGELKGGSVYLIRSGAHYKIGRSNQLEKRVKEIRVALPETATLVHAIRTDDPSGIEHYWHRRFADRRANGEWFALTPNDVKAFCKHTFQ